MRLMDLNSDELIENLRLTLLAVDDLPNVQKNPEGFEFFAAGIEAAITAITISRDHYRKILGDN